MTADPWWIQRWAFDQVTGCPARKAVLSALAMMASHATGRCEVRQATLAKQVEVSERSIRGHLRALEEAGLIAQRLQHRIDGKRRCSEFLVLAPGISEWPDGESIATGNQLPEDPVLPATERHSHRQPVAGLELLPLKEQPLNNSVELVKSRPTSQNAHDLNAVERPEVVRLCDLLADAIVVQGVGRRPNPHTKGWHESCRRLLDLDGATERQVEYAIGWVTKHPFWASVIRSMPKLREKWGSVALQIRQEREGVRRGRGGGARDTAGEDMRRMMRVAEELRERGE